ncbi:MAG: sulfatase [bacterium]
MSNQPNILIVTTDQQHHAMMSCAGNEWLSTPNMDRIAARGVRYERAYCSNPVCVPSRFSWWTGRMPSAIGMRQNGGVKGALPSEIHEGAMGHLVSEAGYRAVFAGKIHLPGDLAPESMGFEYLCSDERYRLAVECARFIREQGGAQTAGGAAAGIAAPGGAERPWLLVANFINPHDICHHALTEFATTDFEKLLVSKVTDARASVDGMLDLAKRWDEEEFFAKHCPPLPPNYDPQEDEPEAIAELVDYRPFRRKARDRWGEREWRLHRWVYHRLTERVDEQIGVLLDALETSGQADNTVVIFTSDHGDHDSSHRLEHKTIFYEEAARVPLLVADPHADAATPGSSIGTGLVQTGLDLMATVCDYAGVESPAHNLGMSLRPSATGESARAPRDGVYAENEVSYMYVTEEHKFVRYDRGANGRQLYDLVRDPAETRNWIGEPGNDEIARELETRLDAEKARHDALSLADRVEPPQPAAH